MVDIHTVVDDLGKLIRSINEAMLDPIPLATIISEVRKGLCISAYIKANENTATTCIRCRSGSFSLQILGNGRTNM
jgi:hypothetical protein